MREYLKLPRINGRTDAEQIAQLKSYLYQTVQQLNFVLSAIEDSTVQKEEMRKTIRDEISRMQTGETT